MTELANFFYPSPTYTIVSVAVAGVVGFVIGYLIRSGIIRKYKKRVLSLEDEMLSSHSCILELEKQTTDLKNQKLIMKGKSPAGSKTVSKTS
ncbi:MAG TPA: hypothetical protein VN958_19420 [Chitinophagaceae bacterium]|nr:hypothetical protein [Chitinophagaceae bacterium]